VVRRDVTCLPDQRISGVDRTSEAARRRCGVDHRPTDDPDPHARLLRRGRALVAHRDHRVEPIVVGRRREDPGLGREGAGRAAGLADAGVVGDRPPAAVGVDLDADAERSVPGRLDDRPVGA
jgi:hypothetical protein